VLVLGVVVAVVVDAIADFGFDVVAVAAAAAVSSAVDDGYDCDCDDDSVAFSTYRIFACKDRVPVESALARSSCVGVRSASSDWYSRGPAVAVAACYDSSERNRDSLAFAAFASAARPSHTIVDLIIQLNF